MARLFLSHASHDTPAALQLKAWLDGEGYATFLDADPQHGIAPGADWEQTLYRALQRCQALLILQSPHWSASRWCFAEFVQARALGKPIFQIVDDDAGAAEPPIAADLQRLDLRHDREAGLSRLRDALTRLVLRDQNGFPWPPPADPGRPPYPGMLQFEDLDAAVFFGRDDDWRAVIERLTLRRVQGGPRLLALQGASGTGKSSLLRAGVLPRLRHDPRWLVLPPIRPETRPFDQLCQGLGLSPDGAADPEAIATQLEGRCAELRRQANRPEARILLAIDQAEELFTVADPHQRDRCLQVLAIAFSRQLPIQGLLTIRSNEMGRLQACPALLPAVDPLLLRPMALERFREIIEGPARVAGLPLDPALVDRAIHDSGSPDSLPLLAFALRQLVDRHSGAARISLADYLALGDPGIGLSPLANAVRQAADGVIAAQRPTPSQLQALRDAFVPALVQIRDHGGFSRCPAPLAALPIAARPLLDALVAARLLVQHQRDGEPITVEIAHEALLRHWSFLSDWLEDSRDHLLTIDRLQRERQQWLEISSQRPADADGFLLQGARLDRALRCLRERPAGVPAPLRDFIHASLRQRRAVAIRRALRLAGTGGVAAALAALGVWWLQQPQVAATLLTRQALITGRTTDIRRALAARHEQRRRILVARSPALPPACAVATGPWREFCTAEVSVDRLLQLDGAPFRFATLAQQLRDGRYGRAITQAPTDVRDRFSAGALQLSALMLFDAQGAGADVLGGNPGEIPDDIQGDQKAAMLPCDLLRRIRDLWRQATQGQCHLFRPDGSAEQDWNDPGCTRLMSDGRDGQKEERKTVGFWLFREGVDQVARRAATCAAR